MPHLTGPRCEKEHIRSSSLLLRCIKALTVCPSYVSHHITSTSYLCNHTGPLLVYAVHASNTVQAHRQPYSNSLAKMQTVVACKAGTLHWLQCEHPMSCRFDCMNTVTALGHSRDARLAPGGHFVALFDSSKQEQELEQLHKEESLVKVHTLSQLLGQGIYLMAALVQVGWSRYTRS